MQHKGEMVEKAVRESGYPITRLAKKLGKTARWMYFLFNNPNAPVNYILEIGEAIHYDFSEEIDELKKFRRRQHTIEATESMASDKDATKEKNEAEYWKNKYLELLEQYTALLRMKN